MILRKYMSMIGIGSAKIDLQLPEKSYQAGETVRGLFHIKGGTIEQKLNRIDCDLVRIDKLLKKEQVIGTATVLTSTIIEAEEQSLRNFIFQLPEDLQCSSETVLYQFKTRLTFSEGVESRDQDFITVL
ncbi:sporulation protein [Bacillus salacetis]|uniref:Sporulation protein n=1 Tax=Bacillus salacetis TaxID=2315464 RepID=A0A3A1R6L8_9BACI|nr:sporulation protein [Bacillus salacetis]RIW38478.1 sporulation protein [Bacillus salacetis]